MVSPLRLRQDATCRHQKEGWSTLPPCLARLFAGTWWHSSQFTVHSSAGNCFASLPSRVPDCAPDTYLFARTRCQAASIERCTEFSSNAFEEFGLTKVYALVTPMCDKEKRSSGGDVVTSGVYTFGYQIFKENDCTGNPFGFEVKQSGMELEECTPLELPFVDNQVDFAFFFECEVCDKSATLSQIAQKIVDSSRPTASSTTTSTTSTTQPPTVDYGPPPFPTPTVDGFPFAARTCGQSIAQCTNYNIARGRVFKMAPSIAIWDLFCAPSTEGTG